MKKRRFNKGIITFSLIATLAFSASSFAASWSTNLDRWSGTDEVSTLLKSTSTATYYMSVSSVGSTYDCVEHWIETTAGSNRSDHKITKEGSDASPTSTALKGDEIVLNVKNPVNIHVEVTASGSWTPN